MPTSYPVSRDSRYTIRKEAGVYVARFGEEVICESPFYSSVQMRCVGHHAVQNGATIITSKES